MKVEEILLQNFQPFYGEVPVTFGTTDDTPITLIRADNDRGKTAFLRAVNFCLYGEEDREDLDDYINRKASTEGDGETRVQLKFGHEGNRYSVNRIIEFEQVDDPQKKEAKDGTTVVVEEIDEEGEYVDDIVEPGDPQSAYDEFIDNLLPEEASRYFFFDGEQLEDYAESFGKDNERVRSAIESVLGIREIKKAIDDLGNYGEDYYDRKWKDAESQVEELGELKEQVDEVDDELEETRGKRNDTQEKIEEQESELDEVKDDIADAADVKDKRQEITRIEEEIRSDGGINDKLESKEDDLNGVVTQLGPLAAVTGAELAYPESQIGLEGGESGVITTLLDAPNCICDRTLEDEHRDILRGKLRTLGEEGTQKLIRIRDETEAHLDYVDSDDVDSAREKYNELSAEIQELESRKSDLVSERERLQSIIDSVGVGEDDLEELRQERDEINQEIGRLDTQLDNLRSEIESLQSKKSELEKQIDDIEGAGEEETRYRRLRNLSRAAKDAWKDIREDYVHNRRISVQNHTEDVFLELTNKPDVYTGLEISEGYQLRLETKSGTRRFEDQNPSTGARQMISYSFIAGLNRFTARDAPVVIDTPFARLDPTHRQNLLEYLPEFQDQIVILYQPSELTGSDIEIIEDYVADHYEIVQGDDPEDSEFERYGGGD